MMSTKANSAKINKNSTSAADIARFGNGILSAAQIKKLNNAGVIKSGMKIDENQIQPASIDLRLGCRAWRVRASFLPGSSMSVEAKLNMLKMYEVDLTHEAVLEKGCVYIVELEESINLPSDITAFANPKSSTGRLDIFTRMIVDCATEFETAQPNYSGPLYAEVSPRSFSVVVRRGSRLSQLRFRKGETSISDTAMKRLQEEDKIVYGGGLDGGYIRDGMVLSADLSGRAHSKMPGLVGWRARKHAGLIDVDKPKFYAITPFWEKITTDDLSSGGGLVLNPDEFYILASREYVVIPPDYAAEMAAYDTRIGEFRAHYAGFFDPGFGRQPIERNLFGDEKVKTRAVLEVRSHDVPFMIEEDQPICRLVYERMSEVPELLYGGAKSGSNYQAQGLQLAKHFKAPEGAGND